MKEQRADEEIQQSGTGIGVQRRGILAAAGAVVAGIVAKQTAQPVLAADVVLGADTNFTSTKTAIINRSTSSPRVAIHGYMAANAVQAAPINFDVAVAGTVGSGLGYGIYGKGSYGVVGESSGADGIGALGQCNTATGVGVQGQSTNGVGVFGVSNGNAGVLGITTAPGNAGLGGITNIDGTAAFAGTSTNPNAFAGFFTGDVLVNGNFTVVDPTKKHGAIAHPDGSYRILYSIESPESWLEDFGETSLVGGKAVVTLDVDFAAVMQTDGYHVFAMPRDAACKGLAIVAQTASGFVVQELNGGTSDGAFSYRVVAKPKTTNKAARLAKFTVPDIKLPQPPKLPAMPVATVPDAPPQAAPPRRPNPPDTVPPQGSETTQGSTTSPVQPAPPPRP